MCLCVRVGVPASAILSQFPSESSEKMLPRSTHEVAAHQDFEHGGQCALRSLRANDLLPSN